MVTVPCHDAPVDGYCACDQSRVRVDGGTDAIVEYRAFVAVVVAAYFTLIALTP